MKKLRFPALLLAAILAFTYLASCNRRKEFEELYESRQEASETASVSETNILEVETDAEEYIGPFPSTTGYKLNHVHKESDRGYYEGKTKEEIQEMFNPSPDEYNFGNSSINTPLGFVIWSSRGHDAFYNKQTGNVSSVCPDPLCHPFADDCKWANHSGYVYCSKDHIYFVQGEFATEERHNYALYRSDTERNNLERLYVFEGWPQIWYIDGDTVYLSYYHYRANQTDVSSFARMDIVKTATATECQVSYISDVNESVEIDAVVGGKVYFRYIDSKEKRREDTYVTDLSFKDPTLAFEHTVITGYTDQYLFLKEWDEDFESIYSLKTGERRDVTALFTRISEYEASGNYIYYIKMLTQEEINSSPLKDYYLHPLLEQWSFLHCDGRLWRMNLDTLEEECVFRLTYNDIPVKIQSFKPDGNICYIEFGTYEHFQNGYNPDYKDTFIRPWPRQHAVIDFSNGTLNVFNLDGIDYGLE